jgi:hypothetical protein
MMIQEKRKIYKNEDHISQEGENQVILIELSKLITKLEGCKNQEEDSSLPHNNCGVLWSIFSLNCGDRGSATVHT